MFFQPVHLAEALEIRARLGVDVLPLGGGTDIVPALNRGLLRPRHLLDLTRTTGYSDVRREDGEWFLGGGATFGRIAGELSAGGAGGAVDARGLVEAAMSVGGPAIRNRATIAGNLGTASPAGDGCVALLAIDAEVEIGHATRGRRRIAVAEYFTGFRQTALMADELITAVRFRSGWKTAWYKIGKRGATNISVVCCAVGVAPPAQGGAASARRSVRIALGSVAPVVMRARRAEAIIEDAGLTDEAIKAAAAAAMQEVSPIDDHRASAAYRRAMCGVLVRRLMEGIEKGELRM